MNHSQPKQMKGRCAYCNRSLRDKTNIRCDVCDLVWQAGYLAGYYGLKITAQLTVEKMREALVECDRVLTMLPNRPIIGNEGEALIFVGMHNLLRKALALPTDTSLAKAYEGVVKDSEEALRLLNVIMPSSKNHMIDWAVKSKDSVYTYAGAARETLRDSLATLNKIRGKG